MIAFCFVFCFVLFCYLFVLFFVLFCFTHQVVESSESLISKLLEYESKGKIKYVKASKHAKSMFSDPKMHFPPKSQNAQLENTCIIRIWIQEVKDI